MRSVFALALSYIWLMGGHAVPQEHSVDLPVSSTWSNSVNSCKPGERILISSDDSSSASGYRSAMIIYDCSESQNTISLVDEDSKVVELTKFSNVDGAKIIIDLVDIAGDDEYQVLLVIFGHEPPSDDSDEIFEVDIYDLNLMTRIYQISSRDQPQVGDLNGDGISELITSENLFSIDHILAPGWPRLLNLAVPLRALSLSDYPSVADQFLMMSLEAEETLEGFCRRAASGECLYKNTLEAIGSQIRALESVTN